MGIQWLSLHLTHSNLSLACSCYRWNLTNNIWDVTDRHWGLRSSLFQRPFPLTSTAVACILGSIVHLFQVDWNVSNLVCNAFIPDTLTILVGKWCWSIFIDFSALVGTTNLSHPYSITDWIYCLNILQSLVSCDVTLCNLQHLIFISSSADDIEWLWESLIYPCCSSRSNILSALVTSRPSLWFFFVERTWPDFLVPNPLHQSDLGFFITWATEVLVGHLFLKIHFRLIRLHYLLTHPMYYVDG
jgi:hypothetical protein